MHRSQSCDDQEGMPDTLLDPVNEPLTHNQRPAPTALCLIVNLNRRGWLKVCRCCGACCIQNEAQHIKAVQSAQLPRYIFTALCDSPQLLYMQRPNICSIIVDRRVDSNSECLCFPRQADWRCMHGHNRFAVVCRARCGLASPVSSSQSRPSGRGSPPGLQLAEASATSQCTRVRVAGSNCCGIPLHVRAM